MARLVTFDGGRVGELRGDTVVELDVASMREYFERGGADDAQERKPLAELDRWLARYRKFWTNRLDALAKTAQVYALAAARICGVA